MKKTIAFIGLLAIIFAFTTPYIPSTMATEKDDLQRQIEAKNRELERISQEMQSTKTNLEDVQKQKQLLQREIQTLQTSMKQLDLYIKSDEVTLQKLDLEINSLSFDLKSLERTQIDKTIGVEQVFRELQKGDGDSMLILLLRHESLESALSQVKSLTSLKQQLLKDIQEIITLRQRHSETLGQVSTKKSSVEEHKVNLANKKIIVADQRQETQSILSQTKNKESTYESKLTELKTQQNSIEEEIDKIEAQLKKNFNSNVLPTKTHNVFSWPVAQSAGRITQNFGEVSYLYRGKPHNGMDIGVPVGTAIVAAADGVVSAVDNNDISQFRKYQYGKYILIKHDNNLATLYAHLSRYIVSPGQEVKRGQVIGYSGSTGYSTGPHLHFGAYWAPSIQMKSVPPAAGLVPIGVVVNPADYL